MAPKLEIFSEKSCVVFVSLAEKFACVTKATKNVNKVLGYTFEELNNQNIKIVMPASIAALHDQFLEKFIKNSGLTDESD
jgi:hypothetical protein